MGFFDASCHFLLMVNAFLLTPHPISGEGFARRYHQSATARVWTSMGKVWLSSPRFAELYLFPPLAERSHLLPEFLFLEV